MAFFYCEIPSFCLSYFAETELYCICLLGMHNVRYAFVIYDVPTDIIIAEQLEEPFWNLN